MHRDHPGPATAPRVFETALIVCQRVYAGFRNLPFVLHWAISVTQQAGAARIGVAIIEDQKETREGLSVLINASPRFECRHAYASMEAALDGIGLHSPRIALVDIGLPGLNGIEGVKILRDRWPAITPVILTVYKDDSRIFQAICAGACGYLLKNTAPTRLMEALAEIAAGGAAMSPEVAIRVVELFRNTQAPRLESGNLSPQEMRILKLLTEGHQNKTAAAELGYQHSHRRFSSAVDLRKTARAFPIRSRGARST